MEEAGRRPGGKAGFLKVARYILKVSFVEYQDYNVCHIKSKKNPAYSEFNFELFLLY